MLLKNFGNPRKTSRKKGVTSRTMESRGQQKNSSPRGKERKGLPVTPAGMEKVKGKKWSCRLGKLRGVRGHSSRPGFPKGEE